MPVKLVYFKLYFPHFIAFSSLFLRADFLQWTRLKNLIIHSSPLTSSLHSACLHPYSLMILQTYSPASDLWAELIIISLVSSSGSRTVKRPAVFTVTLSFNLGQQKVAVTVVYTQVFNRGPCVSVCDRETVSDLGWDNSFSCLPRCLSVIKLSGKMSHQ